MERNNVKRLRDILDMLKSVEILNWTNKNWLTTQRSQHDMTMEYFDEAYELLDRIECGEIESKSQNQWDITLQSVGEIDLGNR